MADTDHFSRAGIRGSFSTEIVRMAHVNVKNLTERQIQVRPDKKVSTVHLRTMHFPASDDDWHDGIFQ